MPDWISHEPLAWTALVNAIIDLAIVFGAPITTEQKTAIIATVGAVSVLFVRSKVTSEAKIDQVPIARAALDEAHEQKKDAERIARQT